MSEDGRHGSWRSQAKACELVIRFTERLNSAMAERKVDVRYLWLISGINQSQIRVMTQGQAMPTIRTIQRLAQALNTTAGWLAFGEEG